MSTRETEAAEAAKRYQQICETLVEKGMECISEADRAEILKHTIAAAISRMSMTDDIRRVIEAAVLDHVRQALKSPEVAALITDRAFDIVKEGLNKGQFKLPESSRW